MIEAQIGIPLYAFSKIIYQKDKPSEVERFILPYVPEELSEAIFCQDRLMLDGNPVVIWYETTRVERVYEGRKLMIERRIENTSVGTFEGDPHEVTLHQYNAKGSSRSFHSYTQRSDGTMHMIFHGMTPGMITDCGAVWEEDLLWEE